MTELTREGWDKFWKSVEDSKPEDKDTLDWMDMLAGKIVDDADPYNKAFALTVRRAIQNREKVKK